MNPRLERRLKRVEKAANDLDHLCTAIIKDAPNQFPSDQHTLILDALKSISRVRETSVFDLLIISESRLSAIRSEDVLEPLEDAEDDEFRLNPFLVEIETPLGQLMAEITTALDYFRRGKDSDEKPQKSDEIDPTDDQKLTRDQAIAASHKLADMMKVPIAEAEALVNLRDDNMFADFIRGLYGIDVANKLTSAIALEGTERRNYQKAIDVFEGAIGWCQNLLSAADGTAEGRLAKRLADAATNLRDESPWLKFGWEVLVSFKTYKEETDPPPPFDLEKIKEGLINGIPPHHAHISQITSLAGEESFSPDQCKKISNLSVFSALTSLQDLNLTHSNIADVSALSGLTSLQNLFLGHTDVRDISALSNLRALQGLYLHSTEIGDVSGLSELIRLRVLTIAETVSDISSLSGLNNLEDLNLEGSQVRDISPLSGLTSLHFLDLSNTEVSDVTALSGLTSLQRLYLNGTQVSDISSLSRLTMLHSINLPDGTKIGGNSKDNEKNRQAVAEFIRDKPILS